MGSRRNNGSSKIMERDVGEVGGIERRGTRESVRRENVGLGSEDKFGVGK